MKMKNFLPLVFFFPFLVSCVQKVDLELEEGASKVVIEGYLVTETDSSYVKLSRSISYFNTTEPPAITDATVEISGDGNTTIFQHVGDGVYKGLPGYKPQTSVTYNLKVIVDGTEYTSASTLYPMFEVDTALSLQYKPASGFFPEGYAVTYWSIDSREDEIFTEFTFGQNDTFFDQRIYFTNTQIIKNQRLPFELPFFRPQPEDSIMLVFKSLDVPTATYLQILANLNSGAPGPFQTPPANPPTNISGGAVGYFRASDVVRIGKVLP